MTTVSNQPATKADVKEAIDQAIDEVRRTDLAEIRAQMATKAYVKEAIGQAIDELRRTDLAEIRAQMATKQDLAELRADLATNLDIWGHALRADMRQQINGVVENIRDWIKVIQEQTAAATSAANVNTAALRADFEAHRDDTHVHRTPRRRRS